jgi:hypothetical protein
MIELETGRCRQLSFAGIVATLGLAACAHATPATPGTAAAAATAATAAPDPAKTTYSKMAPLAEYLMDRDAEIALAKSAAPAPISDNATVLVLTTRGYEEAVAGKNGFVCLVERSWVGPFDAPEFWNPTGRAPECLNPPAARSALPVNLKRTEMALAGLSMEQMVARLKELVAQKAFPAPEIGAMSYMMSKHQHLSDAAGHWHPHLMFYVPGDMGPSVWGANLPGESPVYKDSEGVLPGGGYLPWTLFFVPVAKWSDGTSA